MDVVRVFNNELSSLYEVKPPISKGKMTQITKCAIKGIKFYKHIVQSVEKFIQKCRPEYKVPGLYVVDSIVRQSRHQFGADKDVFAPRFTKNIAATFMNLFKCAEEDRPKIVRVLNLWQKNSVFPSDVIQPLLDMANPNSSGEWPFETQQVVSGDSPVRKVPSTTTGTEVISQNSKSKSADLSSWKGWPQSSEEPVDDAHNYSEITTKNLEKFTKANYASSVVPDAAQVPQVKTITHKSTELTAEENTVKFNKKLLDFDYGDEDDDEEIKTDDGQMPGAPNPLAFSMAQNFLSNPELLRQVQQMQQTLRLNEALKSELAMQPQVPVQKDNKERYSPDPPDCSMDFCSNSQNVSAIPYPDQLQSNVIPYPFENNAVPYVTPQPPQIQIAEPKLPMEAAYQHPMIPDEQMLMQSSQVDEDDRMIYSMPGEPPLPPQDLDERAIVIPTIDDRIRKEHSRSRSRSRSRARSSRHRSRSRSPRRRKSRSTSRSRSKRNCSRSRERERGRERQREREREREKERERQKRGIPPIKKNCISVCSTTLWLGHVPKTLSEVNISTTFRKFGTVLSIDMIPPRGCAYVVMEKRQDAHCALEKLKNLKLQGSTIKMAWAPGKGVKGKEFKDYWDADLGVSYIPFEKVPQNDNQILALLEEGGFIDEESLPQNLKDSRKDQEKEKDPVNNKDATEKLQEVMIPSGTSGPSGMVPNTSIGIPMVIPQMMQPQFGMPLPGLLPPQSMVVQMPVAVPPPNQLMMVQPPAQTLLAGTPLPVGSIPQMPHMSLPHSSLPPSSLSMSNVMSNIELGKEHSVQASMPSSAGAGDATPTDEDGTSVSSPSATSIVQTLSTVSGPSASLPSMGTQASASPFNPGLPHHGMSRPMFPVMPPVSSAGTPIPFPPPQVGFGFPPPPQLRPGVPNQNLPGCIPVPNSFPWVHKTSAPAFGGYTDSEMRFTSSLNTTGVNVRPPMMNQASGHPSTSISNQVGAEHQRSQSVSKDLGHKTQIPAQKDKGLSGSESGKTFGNRSNSNAAHVDIYGLQGGNSPSAFNKDHDMAVENQDDVMPVDFPPEIDMGMVSRFPGPPDFHPSRGGIRPPWMHGPGPRFPRNMHPGGPFPPRVGGAMHPRMEMDFFRHQGPPGPRMHMQGPHGQQPMWGGNGFPPPRGQDRYQNRRDNYDDAHYPEEGRERRYHSREDRGRGKDHWDDVEQGNEDEKKILKSSEVELSADDRDKKNADLAGKKTEDKVATNPKTEVAVKPPPKPVQKVDLTFDLFRLRSYGTSRKSGTSINIPKNKKEDKNNKSQLLNQGGNTEKNSGDSKCEIVPTVESNPKEATSNEVPVKVCDSVNKDSDKVDQSDGTLENRSRRDRSDRKRSRWGRTLSQEREFQQQRINEIEMKFQNYETMHQVATESAAVNGSSSIDNTSVDTPASENKDASVDIPINSCSVVTTVSNDSALLDTVHSKTDVSTIENNQLATACEVAENNSSSSDENKMAVSDLFDSDSTQVTLAS